MKTRTVQEIFNVVIKNNLYSIESGNVHMCVALYDASVYNIISTEDYYKAKESIKNYLGSIAFLSTKLEYLNRPSDFEARLAIYKNWKARPRTKLKNKEK